MKQNALVVQAGRSVSDAEAAQIHKVFLWGIGTGREITCRYSFHRKPGARELADIEKAVNGLVTAIMRKDLNLKVPARFIKIDFSQLEKIDDGSDNDVILRLDFGKILPWDRPAEMVAAAESLFPEEAP